MPMNPLLQDPIPPGVKLPAAWRSHDYISVDCRSCGVSAGSICRTSTGGPAMEPHQMRVYAYRAQTPVNPTRQEEVSP